MINSTQQKQEQATEKLSGDHKDRLSSDFNIIDQLVKARHQAKLTQADIAASMRTTASAIARLESGGGRKKHSPSLRTLRMYADALNCDIKMQLVAKKPASASDSV